MYPYHNCIKRRIKAGELESFVFADEYKGIKDCILLIFSTYPHIRVIRNYRFVEYLPILNNFSKMIDFQEIKSKYQMIFGDSDTYCDAVFSYVYSCDNIRYLLANERVATFTFLLDKKISVCNKLLDSIFFSGVGTIPDFRGQGYMKNLVKTCLLEGASKGIPLATLSPANENYYSSCGFRTIERGERVENLNAQEGYSIRFIESAEEYFSLYSKLNSISNVFIKKNIDDCEKILKVLSCDGGGVFKVFEGDNYLGYFLYDGSESFEYDLDITAFSKIPYVKNYTKYGAGESRFMARILRVDSVLDGIECLVDLDINITVLDKFLDRRENLILKNRNGVIAVNKSNDTGVLISVEDLTDWYFGRSSPICEKVFGFRRECKITLFDRYL